MKNYKILLASAILAAAMAGACSEERFAPEGEGCLMLSAAINADVRDASRADAEMEALGENCIIWISNDKGLVRRYIGINNLPADGIKLLNGRYTVEAWAGDSVTASFDSRWFKGRESFEITAGSMERKTVVCRIANVVARVNYNETVDEVLSDYTMTIANSRGQLVYTGRTDADGYFMMPKDDTKLSWKLVGKKVSDGSEFSKSGEILDVKPATRYTVSVSYTNREPDDIGGAYLDIKVDTEEILVEDNVVISTAPTVQGYNFDINSPVVGEQGAIGRRSLFVIGSAKLTSVVLSCDAFPELLGIDGNDFDFIDGIDAAVLEKINNAGINATFFPTSDGAEDRMLKIRFEEAFTSRLTNGEYAIDIAATDVNGKTSHTMFNISVTDAKTQNEPLNVMDTYSNRAVLRGSVLKDGVSAVGFNYRRAGASEWSYIESAGPTTVGSVFTAAIEGLAPATNYEYATVADGVASTAVSTFRTEPAAQLPNSSFEDWSTGSDNAALICLNESDMFWDSGNHGSITMKINITNSTTELVHSGSKAAKLESAYPSFMGIGKFAAGNAFVGKYLATDGTDGILGFGRPFEGRPTALRLYVRYEPVEINRLGTNLPDFVKTSGSDEGMVYVALLDDNMQTVEYKGSKWQYPVTIQTKSRKLFNKDDEHVIAYGERVFTERTAGDGFEEVVIPIDYRRTDIKPSNIALVISGSRFGDYFTGGEGTVMYVDDVELIY